MPAPPPSWPPAASDGGDSARAVGRGASGDGGATDRRPARSTFANWDAYIDLTEDGDGEYDLPSPTLDDFNAEYGVEVDYANAEIEDNETFMATIRRSSRPACRPAGTSSS